jgi:hypothetical protein
MAGGYDDDNPTRRIDPTRRATPGQRQADPFTAETVRAGQQPIQQGQTSPPTAPSDLDAAATRLIRPGSTSSQGQAPAQSTTAPVVGWLVVLKGPGQGMSLPLGYGLNSVGRGPSQRVRLDFGDDQVSRDTHFSVAYDAKHRKFYLQHGGGQNLTYMNDQPVLAPAEIEGLAEIAVGNTVLKFVPFCGAAFDWEDIPESSDGGD